MRYFLRNKIFHFSSMCAVEYDLTRFPMDTQAISTEIGGELFVSNRLCDFDQVLEMSLEKAISKMDFTPPFTLDEARRRLERGHYLIIVETDGMIVGWSWAGVGMVHFGEFDCVIKLNEGHAFSFNTYIDKEYRGKGLNQLVLNQQLLCLKKDGFKKVWALIHVDNKASLRSYLKNGWRNIGYYRFLKLFFMSFRFPPEGI